MAKSARAATPTRREIEQAKAYAELIAEICKLSAHDHGKRRRLEQEVFIKLGWETVFNKRGYMIRQPGDSHWQSMPQILTDFGTAISHTIGHRFGTLDRPLEANWYIQDMCETAETVRPDGARIAAWAVRLAKHSKESRDATAITPASALVAAWLRTHERTYTGHKNAVLAALACIKAMKLDVDEESFKRLALIRGDASPEQIADGFIVEGIDGLIRLCEIANISIYQKNGVIQACNPEDIEKEILDAHP